MWEEAQAAFKIGNPKNTYKTLIADTDESRGIQKEVPHEGIRSSRVSYIVIDKEGIAYTTFHLKYTFCRFSKKTSITT